MSLIHTVVFCFQFNFSHTINQLSFGEHYPGIVNPLNGYSQVPKEDPETGKR